MQFHAGLMTGACLAFAATAAQAAAATTSAVETTTASAEPTTEVAVEEVVITASRRAETLSKVPTSVAAYNRETLDQKTIRTIDDITRNTPGITFGRGFGNTSSISIRGVAASGAGTTGIYIDDTPIQVRSLNVGAYNVYPLVFDLDRVEVLRGPQGTLFGAGSEGGTIRFITPQPSLTSRSVYARAEVNSVAHGGMGYEAGVAVGGPIVEDRLGVRLSAWRQHTGGYIDQLNVSTNQITDRNINDSDATVLRGAVTWAVTDRLSITPSIYYQRQNSDDIGQYWREFSRPDDDVLVTGITTAQPSRDSFNLPALLVNYRGDGFSITSNTSYFSRRETSVYDYSTLIPAYFVQRSFDARFPNYPAYAYFLNRQKIFTQEIRAQSSSPDAKLKWLVGAFYQDAKQSAHEDIIDPRFDALIGTVYNTTVAARFGQAVINPGSIILLQNDITHDKQYSAFGELSYTLWNQLTLSAGARVARTRFGLDNFASGPFNGGRTTFVIGRTKDKTVNPRFALSWQADRDSLYYITVAKGFRPGGINQTIPYVSGICKEDQDRNGGPAPTAYESDSIWSYELGLKKSFFNRRLYVDGSVYSLKWKNIQQGRGACGLSYIDNSGQASSKGFDVAATLRLDSHLTLGITAGYIDSHYTQTIYGGLAPGSTTVRTTSIRKGDALTTTPYSWTANVNYSREILGLPSYARLDYEYRGGEKLPAGLNPNNTGYNIDSLSPPTTNFFTVRAGTRFNGFDVSMFVRNVFDSNRATGRFFDRATVKGLNKEKTFQPRTIGLTAIARY